MLNDSFELFQHIQHIPPMCHKLPPTCTIHIFGNSFLFALFFIMSSVPYWKQAQEQSYFNWKCYICCIVAQSPLHLEEQFIVEHGPYKDVNGDMWVKCSKCINPYHLKCLNLITPPPRPFLCSFLSCNVK